MHRLSRQAKFVLFVFAMVALFFTQGCNKSIPIEGSITVDGIPLEGAEVAFFPDDIRRPSGIVSATTGKGGSFKTQKQAKSGTYKVTVSKYEKMDTADFKIDPNDPDVMKNAMGQLMRNHKKPKSEIDEKYGDPNKTELRVTVPPGNVGELKVTK